MTCPLNLDKDNCQRCFFAPDGICRLIDGDNLKKELRLIIADKVRRRTLLMLSKNKLFFSDPLKPGCEPQLKEHPQEKRGV